MYRDRLDAGRVLADALPHLDAPVVLGLPRGGVPVAAVVAERLGAPLDVIIVRKVGVPWHPEVAMGAIGEGGARVTDERTMRWAAVSPDDFAAVEARERRTLDARITALRNNRPPLPLQGRTALIVDDGIATGATARVAMVVARARGAISVVVAAPVAAADTIAMLAREADAVVVPLVPAGFRAVGEHYVDFRQTTDEEVQRLLGTAEQA